MAEETTTTHHDSGSAGPTPPFDPIDYLRPWANILVLLGLLLVLVARGCGTMSAYSAQAAAGKAEVRLDEMQFEHNQEEEKIKADIREIDEMKEPSDSDRERKKEYEEKLREVEKENREELGEFRRGDYAELQHDAKVAKNELAGSRWWSELWFLLGAIILTAGLITIGFTRAGPERMVALIIIAIIALYLFGGGGGIPVRSVG